MTAMKAGISVWLDRAATDFVELAVTAEEAGLSDVWLPDHYFLRDVYVTQALMATQTSTLTLGTSVAAIQARHPAMIASSAATVAELAGGRCIIGIGPGGYEFAGQFGLRPDSPLTAMRDSVAIMRALMTGRTDHDGAEFSAVGSQLGWSAESMPIYLAARGPKMTELAGEIADGVIIHGLNAGYIEYVREKLAVGAARVGRDPGACEIMAMFDVEIDDDEAAAIDRLRPRCTIMAGGTYSDGLIPIYGLDPDDVARLRTHVSSSSPEAKKYVTDQMVDTFAVGGSLGTVAKRLEELRELGIGRAVMKLGEGGPEDTRHQIELIAPVIKEICA